MKVTLCLAPLSVSLSPACSNLIENPHSLVLGLLCCSVEGLYTLKMELCNLKSSVFNSVCEFVHVDARLFNYVCVYVCVCVCGWVGGCVHMCAS